MPTPPTYTNAFAVIGTPGKPLDGDYAYTWGQNRTPLICYSAASAAPNYAGNTHSYVYALVTGGIPYVGENLYNGKPGGGLCTIWYIGSVSDNQFLFGSIDKLNDPPTYVYDQAGIDMDQVEASLIGATVTKTGSTFVVTDEAVNFNHVAQSISGYYTDDIISIAAL